MSRSESIVKLEIQQTHKKISKEGWFKKNEINMWLLMTCEVLLNLMGNLSLHIVSIHKKLHVVFVRRAYALIINSA